MARRQVGTAPTRSDDAAQQGSVDAGLAAKVDKVTTANRVYTTDSNGGQSSYSLSSSNAGTTVALRGSGGVLACSTPTAANHATPRSFVDAVQSTLQAGIDGKAATSHTHTVDQVTDSGTTGRALVKAATMTAAQQAVGIVAAQEGTLNPSGLSDGTVFLEFAP